MEAARADAERIKRIGEAEAYSVEAVGKAEAESMKLKAQAYKQYGEAAIMSMVLDSLPQVGLLPSQFPLPQLHFFSSFFLLLSYIEPHSFFCPCLSPICPHSSFFLCFPIPCSLIICCPLFLSFLPILFYVFLIL